MSLKKREQKKGDERRMSINGKRERDRGCVGRVQDSMQLARAQDL